MSGSKASKTIENISDTARWVAVYRAAESARPDALFNDRFAALLAGPHGKDIVESIPGGTLMGWAVVVRTRVIDEVILRAVAEQGIDTVLNLAAGLDTRPYRLALPANLHWFEVDLPEISAYKEHKLAAEKPVCRLERITLDLSDVEKRRALFERINKQGGKVLVLTE
ncbi:MAG: class I SAM-dependent methyltransferase, partial [Deltaproteobacteria bacterium]|nr:class I SAM-dependent methyltransferase [Deltaproteobacteria bacterium]